MKYSIDHDLHSYLSSCSKDPAQTGERILQYAKEQGFRHICLTDHFLDDAVSGASKWYALNLIEDDKFAFVARA